MHQKIDEIDKDKLDNNFIQITLYIICSILFFCTIFSTIVPAHLALLNFHVMYIFHVCIYATVMLAFMQVVRFVLMSLPCLYISDCLACIDVRWHIYVHIICHISIYVI